MAKLDGQSQLYPNNQYNKIQDLELHKQKSETKCMYTANDESNINAANSLGNKFVPTEPIN